MEEPGMELWEPTAIEGGGSWDDPERWRAVLAAAVLAPSSHNSQPWLFRLGDGQVELHADRCRALPVADPDDRELIISCGCALQHLRLAIEHFGREPRVELRPDRDRPDLLARVSLGEARVPDDAQEALFHAIPERRTNRRAFEDRPVAPEAVRAMEGDAEREGARMVAVTDEGARLEMADLIAEADRIQLSDRRYRRELASWVHANRSHSRDGMPGYAHGMTDMQSLLGPVVIRTFDVGDGQAARDRDLAEHSPLMALLLTEEEGPEAWLAAGQALARVLLRARAHGLWASFMNQPIELPETRADVARTAGTRNFPQVLLRLGYAEGEVRPTPRRALEDVILSSPER